MYEIIINNNRYYFFKGKTSKKWPNGKGIKISNSVNKYSKIPLNVLDNICQNNNLFVGFDTDGNIFKGIGFKYNFDNINNSINDNDSDSGLYIKYQNYIPSDYLDLNQNQKFDYIPINIKVINLDRRPDRWNKIIKQSKEMEFKKYNITLNRISACDGIELKKNPRKNEKKLLSKMKIINADILNKVKRNKYLRYSEIGCFISHYQIWKDFLNSDDSSEYLFVIEDDIRFRNNFCHILQVLMNKINNTIDEDSNKKTFNYILLGASFHNNNLNILRKLNKNIDNDYLLNSITTDFWGTFSYIISKDTIKIFLNEFELNGCDSPVDCYMRLISKKNKIIINELYPNIVETDLIIDTDIHTDINYFTNVV